MKRFILALAFILFLTPFAQAQEELKMGVELDVLPYLTGGYFGAVWVGKGHFRARALIAKVNMPEFITPDEFTDNTIHAYALVGDYFFKKEQVGLWIGAGIVLWDGSIKDEQKLDKASYQSYLLNGSAGYVFNLSQRFYLSPWGGLSLRVAGDNDIFVNGNEYKPPFLNPELSLKFGYKF